MSSVEGLSCVSVYSLWQDEQRFMWFGSFDGLNRYDGRNIEVFKPNINDENSLSGHIIRNIIGTGDNYLWISIKNGLNKFSLKTQSVEKLFREFNESSYFATDRHNRLFILGRPGFLSVYRRQADDFIHLPIAENITSKWIQGFCIDAQDTVRILYRGLLQNYTVADIDGDHPKTERHNNLQHPCKINYLFYDNKKMLIIDERGDLYRFSEEGKTWMTNVSRLLNENGVVSSLIFDHDDLLIAFKTNGLYRLQASNSYAPENININCGVFALWKDQEQNIVWIATDGQGMYAWVKDDYTFNSLYLSQLPAIKKYRPVRAVYVDKKNSLWLGTKGDGVIRIGNYDKAGDFSSADIQHFSTSDGLSSHEVFVIAPNLKGDRLWMASEGDEINYYSYNDRKIHSLANHTSVKPTSVHALLQQNDTTLWIGSGYTLLRYTLNENETEAKGVEIRLFGSETNQQMYNQIYALFVENDSILWAGMRGNGLVRYNTHSGNYRIFSFNNTNRQLVYDVLCIYRDAEETFWLGSNYGLLKFTYYPDGTYVYKNYNEQSGLPNNMIHGILGNSDNKLWLSTNSGITLFDPIKESFRSFNQKTGLKIIEYSDNAYYKDVANETYFFGSVDGLTWIKPEKEERNNYLPQLHFTKLRIFNREYNLRELEKTKNGKTFLELNYKQNFFAVSFVAVDFVNGENSRYSYKLENFSEAWMNTRQNEAQFTNIPHGKYSLLVRYDDATGNTENLFQSIDIVILPPWYLTVYAKIACSLLIIALIYGIHWFVRMKYKQRKAKIQRELQEKYKEEMYESKLRFFTNITHEISTPLTLIYGPCDRILQYAEGDSFVRKYATMIKSNAERLSNLIQEIIDFRRMETGHQIRRIIPLNISETVKEITDSFAELAERNHIRFETELAPDILWNSDKSCFSKIINNLISNAFKYTPEGGKIRVECRMIEKEHVPSLQMVVHNTGKGIREEDISRIFNRYSVLDNIKENSIKGLSSRNGLGLAICQTMTELLEGSITVNSKVNEYAEFTVSLPALEILEPEAGKRPEPAGMEPASDNNKAEKQPNETIKESILVIDDNSDLLALVGDILSAEYRVITANNGRQGIEVLKHETPAVIITDIMMPEIDGITLSKQIKGNRHTMHIPLVILSAKNTTDDKVQGVKSGADAYISKPFEADYLCSVVRRLIENKKTLEQYYNSSASAFEFSDGQLIQKEDRDFLRQAVEIIDKNIDNNDFSPETLAETMGVSTRAFYRKLKDLNQQSPNDFIKDRRIQHSAKLLVTTNLTIQEIMFQTGFINRSHFHKEFAKRYGKSPKEYRQQNKQQDQML
ncbi:MAG: response regulator [Dysgonamonadaceae bacterium]|jgi:signal transduction histidine kinase/CheY-like chemotaxis protein/AraC-like DNA-binding protein|nr:response regulator [Dysgonamonadaceae bacterium]